MRFVIMIGTESYAGLYKDGDVRLNMYELSSVNHGNITRFGQPGA